MSILEKAEMKTYCYFVTLILFVVYSVMVVILTLGRWSQEFQEDLIKIKG